jgi:hypothetical protein
MMVRSTSEEKADARERWLPPLPTPDLPNNQRVLVETDGGGSYYKRMMASANRVIVGART